MKKLIAKTASHITEKIAMELNKGGLNATTQSFPSAQKHVLSCLISYMIPPEVNLSGETDFS